MVPRVAEVRRAARRSRPDIQIARPSDEPTKTVQDMPAPHSPFRRRPRASRPAPEEIAAPPATAPTPPAPAPPIPVPPVTVPHAPSSHAPLSPVSPPPATVRTQDVRAQEVRTQDIDAWPTQSLHGDDDLDDAPDEKTRIGVPAYEASARMATETHAAPLLESDEGSPLRPAQALRVVVWRTSDGTVHVAPRGTHVSAITVDAMLVAIDPDADLAAWLSGK